MKMNASTNRRTRLAAKRFHEFDSALAIILLPGWTTSFRRQNDIFHLLRDNYKEQNFPSPTTFLARP
jgi:hypothetical protein